MKPVPSQPLGPLAARWQEVHMESLPMVRKLTTHASHTDCSSAKAAAARLSPGVIDASSIEAACTRRSHTDDSSIRAREQLQGCLDEFDRLLDAMYDDVLECRMKASNLRPSDACDRGDDGFKLSPADRCALLSAPLRSYEAELDLKLSIFETICKKDSELTEARDMQALYLAWESQPLLEPIDAMQAGAAASTLLSPSDPSNT